jgi:hypothetical protein
LGQHFGAAITEDRLFIMGIIDEVLCQFMQLPLAGLPLQGIMLIAQASGEVDGDDATFGCQISGNLGVNFPFDVKDDRAAVPIDNLAEFRAGFAAAGGPSLMMLPSSCRFLVGLTPYTWP